MILLFLFLISNYKMCFFISLRTLCESHIITFLFNDSNTKKRAGKLLVLLFFIRLYVRLV